MSDIEITVFRKRNGVLSKQIELDRNGKVHADGSACKMTEGKARRVKLNGIQSLATLIEHMPSEEALALGRLPSGTPDEVKVVLARDLDGHSGNVIARTKDYLKFEPGAPACLLLDHDSKGQPRQVAQDLKRRGGIIKAVFSVAPQLASAARLSRRSTSAGLYHEDRQEWLPGRPGWHVYLAVKDGTDIERALKTLHERLWLAGLGYFVIGEAGQLLDRSIIDAAVYGAERLVFEGAPILVPPVAQDARERRPFVHDGEMVDSLQAIPMLSDEEQSQLAQIKAAERERLKPRAMTERRRWAERYAVRHNLSVEEAERIATAATDSHTLHEEFELEFDELGKVTVGEMLANADRYVGQTLADPLEGVAYGRGKAKVFRLPDRQLLINSFAHGGIKYRLAGQGVGLDDFYAYVGAAHKYMYTPIREAWPASVVNARIPPVPLLNTSGQPVLNARGKQQFISASDWLDRHRPVEQITWAPGEPMLIENRHINEGGWVKRNAVRCFNLYHPPTIAAGDPDAAGPWLDHIEKIYPDDIEHIVKWFAHRVQRPWEKLNHALFLGGDQGIGKDTMLVPVREAVGSWNFKEVSPQQLMGRFNGFLKSVILRVSEARDLGEVNRYAFYEHMKAYEAAPPEVLRCDEKNLREHPILNVCGVVYTSNHKTDGIYLTADDRRHYVAWSELRKEDFTKDYWIKLHSWYENGGYGHVAAYLADIDLSDFDAKAEPPQTAAFWAIVDAGRAPEDAELADAIDELAAETGQEVKALTLDDIRQANDNHDFGEWLIDRKNRRQIPHRLEACGYVQVRNNTAEDGLWKIANKRVVIYARKTSSLPEQLRAAQERVQHGDRRWRQLRVPRRLNQ